MRMYDIIKKKRDGYELSEEEIDYCISAYTNGDIPDYQMSALLMTIYLNKMNDKETLYLTRSMINSGETVDLSNIDGIKVDKHSTGGVGDSITLILGPMVASCGVPFVKMSGRGLGHTGGTLDKLESIKGFNVNLTKEVFERNVNKIGIAIASQTANITPADKKLYALRDVTATIDNMSLIASSIMSKKLAIESNGIILDVKVGSGAFMKSLEDARKLANEMVKLGKNYGRETIALLTNMNQPLGRAVGNALEVKEAIETLKGNGPNDLFELSLVLASKLLVMSKKVLDEKEAMGILMDSVYSGKAYDKFLEFVDLQNGDISTVEDTSLLPTAKYILEVKSKEEGYIKRIDAEEIGRCSLILGAGRETLDSQLDFSAGLVLNRKVDDYVNIGDTICYIHSNDLEKGQAVKNMILEIYEIGEKNPENQALILDEIHG